MVEKGVLDVCVYISVGKLVLVYNACTQIWYLIFVHHLMWPLAYVCTCTVRFTPQPLPFLPCHQSPPHPAGPPPDLQSQLRPFQGLAPHDLQRQLQQLNISQRSGDTSPERQESPTQGHLSGRVSPNSGNSSRKSSFGGPSPAQQPLMGQFMGAHQPIVGASGSGTRIGVAQPTPMASILSVSVSRVCHVTRDAMQVTACCSSPVPSPALL